MAYNHHYTSAYIVDIFGEKTPTFIGVGMAVVGSTLIGISYTASKNAHNKTLAEFRSRTSNDEQLLRETFDVEAAPASLLVDDDYSTINDGADETMPLLEYEYSMSHTMKYFEWWLSIVFLMVGEIFNFMAYGFAPTSVIAPLGTLSIISGAVSGYFYLGEKVNLRNVLGMVISITGSIIIVLFAKSEEPKLSPEAIVKAIQQARFLIYFASAAGLTVFLIILDKTKFPGSSSTVGDRYMVIRVTLTALFSGFTVLATKSISSLLTLAPKVMFTHWITYLMLSVLLTGGLFTLYFTNKALSSFDSTRVLPAEFAAFTFSAVLGSAMLYNDFDHATIVDVLMFLLGCVITFAGVYLITTGTDKKGKPVCSRNSALITAPIINAVQDSGITGSGVERPNSSGSRGNTFPTRSRNQHHSNVFTADRFSRNGINGFLTMLNALGNSRASYSFQQVVLPTKQTDVIILPHSPNSTVVPSFNHLHHEIDPNWGFEVVPTRTEDDEVAFFVRPISRHNSVTSLPRDRQSIASVGGIRVDIGESSCNQVRGSDSTVAECESETLEKRSRRTRIKNLFLKKVLQKQPTSPSHQ